jgi:hypothetical protein
MKQYAITFCMGSALEAFCNVAQVVGKYLIYGSFILGGGFSLYQESL